MKEASSTNNQEPEPPEPIRRGDLDGRPGTGSSRFCGGRGSDPCHYGSSGLLPVFMASAVA